MLNVSLAGCPMPLSAEQETRRPESTLTTRLRPRPSSAPPGPSQVRPGLGDPDATHLTWSHGHMGQDKVVLPEHDTLTLGDGDYSGGRVPHHPRGL